MKQIIRIMCMLLILCSFAVAQFQQGDVEIAFSGNFGSLETSRTSGGSTQSESSTYFNLSITPGYYVANGFSIEPEFALLAVEDEEPAQYVLGNISYTYRLPESDVALFGRAGYGVSNSIQFPVPGGINLRISDKFDVGVLNLGAGVKYVIKNAVALRTEMNYRRHSWTTESFSFFGGSFKSERTYTNIGLLFGFSVLL